MKENYLPLGYLGEYGADFYNDEHHKKLQRANIFVNEYNSKINTFNTQKENFDFAKKTRENINQCLS
jgi:hypothetical protein